MRRLRGDTGLFAALIVTLAAMALRLPTIDRHLPHSLEPDTHLVTYLTARARGEGPLTVTRHTGFYATLLPELLLRIPGLTILERPDPSASLAEHLRAAARPYVVFRITTGALAALLPLITFVLARRYLGNGGAVLAAALVATSLLHLRYSQQARPHGAHATLVWLALLSLVRLVELPSARRALAAGAAVFLAVGSFQSGLLLGPAIVVACWFAGRRAPQRLATAGALVPPFLLAMVACHPGFQLARGGIELGPEGHVLRLHAMNGRGSIVAVRSLWDEDPVLLVLALMGVCVAGRGALGLRREVLMDARVGGPIVLLSYLVPYVLIALLNDESEARYLLPALPALAAAAALTIDKLARVSARDASRWTRYFVGYAGGCLVIPLVLAVRFVQVSAADDTLESAGKWLLQQDPAAGTRTITPTGLVLPILSQREAHVRHQRAPSGSVNLPWPWIDYQSRVHPVPEEPTIDLFWLPASRNRSGHPGAAEVERFLDAHAPRWVVLPVSRRWRRSPSYPALQGVCRRRAELAAVFDGEGGEPVDYENTGRLALRLLSARAFGPRVEIYRWADRR